MDSPYMPPKTAELDTARVARSKRLCGWAACLFGMGVVAPPILGLVGIIKGMAGAFVELKQTGAADPSELAGEISVALLTTFWGLMVSVFSLIPFVVFLVLFLKRRKSLRSRATDQTHTHSEQTASGNG